MAKPYFREVPNFEYVSRNPGDKYISEYISTKNLFKRGKLREDIFGNLSFFEKYSIIGDERPDNVANKFYEDPTLDWIVLLSNNILNIQTEWPMTQSVFDRVMLERYESYDNLYNGIHHYETQEIKNSSGITVLKGGLRISPTWKTNGNFIEAFNDKIYDFYSGDGITPSDIGTIRLFDPIISLEIGSSITIENMPDDQYNGTFAVTEILNPVITIDGDILVYSFTVKLNTTPVNANPLATVEAPLLLDYDNNSYEIQILSGDGLTPSTTATVNYSEGIPNLTIGDSITIRNVSDTVYNGTFLVSNITIEDDENVYSFEYELSQTPENAYPRIEPIEDIRVYENINETFIFKKREFEPININSEEITTPQLAHYYEYWDDALQSSVLIPSTSFIREVSNYEYESQIQNEKRNIYVLKPIYLNIVFDDLEDIMRYKTGSQQYVTENLKRGDNIRLYE